MECRLNSIQKNRRKKGHTLIKLDSVLLDFFLSLMYKNSMPIYPCLFASSISARFLCTTCTEYSWVGCNIWSSMYAFHLLVFLLSFLLTWLIHWLLCIKFNGGLLLFIFFCFYWFFCRKIPRSNWFIMCSPNLLCTILLIRHWHHLF